MIAVGNLGNLSATAPLALAVAYFGWRDSFLVIGWAQLIITVIVLLLVRNRPPHPQSQQETVSSEQQQKIGVMEAWRRVYGLRDFWMLALLAFCWLWHYHGRTGAVGGPYMMNVAACQERTPATCSC
jgi:predicted MFS family arabinose efflux permease